MTSSREVTVAVAGAGLAGLCLAQRLTRAGIDVHVYEKDPGSFVRTQGYRITVDGAGLGALRDSLPPALFELAVATAGEPGGTFRFTNSKLRDAFTRTVAPTADAERQMDRQTLRSVLLTGLDGRVHYGREAVAVEEQATDRMSLRFAAGDAVSASVVVAADGIGSALRQRIAPGADPVDSGLAGIYGRTALCRDGSTVIPEALADSGVLALGDVAGRAFYFTSMRFREDPRLAFARLAPGTPVTAPGDYVMWGLVLRREEAAGVPASESRTLAGRLASGFHPLIRRLIEESADDSTILSTFAVGSRPRTWPLPRATVVGDAIHAMPPFGAHGGNTALRDGALLGARLAEAYERGDPAEAYEPNDPAGAYERGDPAGAYERGDPAEAAIAAYQAEMPGYAFTAVDTAASMMRRLTGGGRLPRLVLTRLLPRLHRVTVPEASIISA